MALRRIGVEFDYYFSLMIDNIETELGERAEIIKLRETLPEVLGVVIEASVGLEIHSLQTGGGYDDIEVTCMEQVDGYLADWMFDEYERFLLEENAINDLSHIADEVARTVIELLERLDSAIDLTTVNKVTIVHKYRSNGRFTCSVVVDYE